MTAVRFVLHPAYGEALRDDCDRLAQCAAPGELLSIAVGLRSERALPDISVGVSPLSGPRGSLPVESADIHIVKVWQQAGIGVYQTRSTSVPELLVKDDREELRDGYTRRCGHWRHLARRAPYYRPPDIRLDGPVRTSLAANEAKQLWITVRLPATCTAATYSSSLIATAGNSSAELPISIEVLPLSLAEAKHDSMLWFKGSLDCRRNQHFLSPDLFEAQLRNIHDHGFRSISLNESDPALLRQAVQIARKVGFRRNVVLSEPFVDGLDAAEFAPMTPIYYLSDELDGRGQATISHHVANWRSARQRGSATMISLLSRSSARRFQPEGDIGHGPDIFSFYLPRNRGDFSHARREGGAELSATYYYWLAHMEKPLVHRLLSGSYLYKSGADGISPYCYQHLPVYPNSPFNDFDEWEPGTLTPGGDGRFRDHMTTYPARRGVLNTVQWKGMSDGLTDLRYLATLDGLIAGAAESPRNGLRERAATVRAKIDRFLDRISLESINIESDTDPMPYPDLSAADLHAFRQDLAREAVVLQRELVPSPAEENSLQ